MQTESFRSTLPGCRAGHYQKRAFGMRGPAVRSPLKRLASARPRNARRENASLLGESTLAYKPATIEATTVNQFIMQRTCDAAEQQG